MRGRRLLSRPQAGIQHADRIVFQQKFMVVRRCAPSVLPIGIWMLSTQAFIIALMSGSPIWFINLSL